MRHRLLSACAASVNATQLGADLPASTAPTGHWPSRVALCRTLHLSRAASVVLQEGDPPSGLQSCAFEVLLGQGYPRQRAGHLRCGTACGGHAHRPWGLRSNSQAQSSMPESRSKLDPGCAALPPFASSPSLNLEHVAGCCRRPHFPAHVETEPRRAASKEQAQDRDAPHWWASGRKAGVFHSTWRSEEEAGQSRARLLVCSILCCAVTTPGRPPPSCRHKRPGLCLAGKAG